MGIESCVMRLEKRGDPRVPTGVGRALELVARFSRTIGSSWRADVALSSLIGLSKRRGISR